MFIALKLGEGGSGFKTVELGVVQRFAKMRMRKECVRYSVISPLGELE